MHQPDPLSPSKISQYILWSFQFSVLSILELGLFFRVTTDFSSKPPVAQTVVTVNTGISQDPWSFVFLIVGLMIWISMTFELVFLTLGRMEGRWYTAVQGIKVVIFVIEFAVSGLVVGGVRETLVISGIFFTPFVLAVLLGYLIGRKEKEMSDKEGDVEDTEGEVRKRTITWIVGAEDGEEDDFFDEEWLERRRERAPLIGRGRRVSCLTV